MSARIEKAAPAKKIQTKQVVIGFDAVKFKAPFLLRCGALLIDYIILISVPALSVILGRFMGYDGSKLLNSTISNSGWLIMFLLGLTNFIIFPMFSGQSIGKILTGLRITNLDGTMPGFSSLLLRHVIGYPLTLATGLLGFILAAFTGKGRALHDYLSGTMVVYGRKKLKQKNLVRKSELTERNVKRKSNSDKK